jgi:tetratricopeptide (TPR) repeat protein
MQILEARALAARQPGCAPAHFALAYLSFRQINAELPAGPEPQAACEAEFRTALRLLPSYPRAAYQLARLKVDTGSAREALEISFRFRKEHPRNVAAFGGLAYAARNSGLLEGAATALRLRENLCGGGLADPGLAENTYLYRGELERFQQTLGEGPLESQEPVRAFYRGYLRLLQGDPAGAKAFFHHASLRHGVDSQFERLAGIYDLALQGRQREALAELDELRIHRASLRVPDGEFTFKLAEAYAFLGQREAAVDTASRAFGQGFGCTQWYRESPLLRELQELPRWRNLLQHLQERQDLIALAFPPERFLHP